MLARKTSDGLAVDQFDAVRRSFEAAPLNAAPAVLRPAVWRLWTLTAHLYPNPLPLAAAVGLWVRDFGLAEDDAAAILAGFTSPKRMGEFRFASDLMTALASAAHGAIERAKRQRELQQQAATRDETAASAADLEHFRDWLARTSATFGPDSVPDSEGDDHAA